MEVPLRTNDLAQLEFSWGEETEIDWTSKNKKNC